jgi:hypothetical protein
VAVASVLSEKVGSVPQPSEGLGRHRQRPDCREQCSSFCWRTGGRLDEQVSGPGHAGAVGQTTEPSAKDDDAALLAGFGGGLGADQIPHLRDVAGHLAVGEVVEDRVDHLGRDVAAQRRRPPGEVGVPHAGQADGNERIGRFILGVGDHGDRLDQLEEPAGGGRGHRCSLGRYVDPWKVRSIVRDPSISWSQSAAPCKTGSAPAAPETTGEATATRMIRRRLAGGGVDRRTPSSRRPSRW